MAIEFLEDRRKALEEAFFRRENARLLAQLRAQREDAARRQNLRAASGLRDDALLEALVREGITAESLAALMLVPLVFVAFGDGKLATSERFAILSAADGLGIARGSPGFALLEGWLGERPHVSLWSAWVHYAQALCEKLGAADREVLRDDVLRRAHEVAKAAGGVVGLGPKIASGQQAVLDKLEAAFSGEAEPPTR
jgi:hypothetical protein